MSSIRTAAIRLRPLGRLALAALVAGSAAPLSAQPAALAPVVVTATREPSSLDRVSADVVVIDSDRIRSSSADSLEDLLRREAGVQVLRNGGPGQNATVMIRGAGSSNTVVVVDGVRIGSATLGLVELEAVPLAIVERVEVLRGPGSSLYGADAVGGVVQIFTRRGAGVPRYSANAALGGYGSSEVGAAASGSVDAFDLAASVHRERSRGVSALRPGDAFGSYNPDDDGYTRTAAQLRAGYAPSSGHRIGASFLKTRLDARYDASEFAPPTFAPDPTPDFRNRLSTEVASIDYRGQLTPAFSTWLQLARNLDDLTSGGNVESRFKTRRGQLTWQNAWKPTPEQQWVIAFERIEERVDSDSFATTLRRHNDAAVVGYSAQLGKQLLQADLRHDANSAYGGVTTGRLGWSVEAVEGLRFRALAGTTFRAPSFNELYFPGYGVATVEPERGRSVEAGIVWRGPNAEATLTVYRNRIRDLIVFEPDTALCPQDPAYTFGCARNAGRARLQGMTISAARRLAALRVEASVDLLDARDLTTGERLPRRAAHQESLRVDFDHAAWRYGAALVVVGARPDAGVRLGAYATLDLRAEWRFDKRAALVFKLLNALDRRIEPLRDYQALGRQAWIGVRYEGGGD